MQFLNTESDPNIWWNINVLRQRTLNFVSTPRRQAFCFRLHVGGESVANLLWRTVGGCLLRDSRCTRDTHRNTNGPWNKSCCDVRDYCAVSYQINNAPDLSRTALQDLVRLVQSQYSPLTPITCKVTSYLHNDIPDIQLHLSILHSTVRQSLSKSFFIHFSNETWNSCMVPSTWKINE